MVTTLKYKVVKERTKHAPDKEQEQMEKDIADMEAGEDDEPSADGVAEPTQEVL